MAGAPTLNGFVMLGAREAMASGLLHIEEQVKGIERAVTENPGLAFDLAKTLIESTCETILSDRAIPFASDDDSPRLFKTAATHLPFLPASAADHMKARGSLEQTLSGLHTAVQGVCELRNNYGFASHGREGAQPAMESVQALLAAQTADAIIGFLYRIHQQGHAPLSPVRLEYEDNPGFNDYVDEAHEPIRIFSLEYTPSEVLFSVDREACRDALEDYESEFAISWPSRMRVLAS